MAEVRQREARQAAYVADAMGRLTGTLESGRPVSLYESVYLPVDSLVNDEQLADGFDLLQVQTLGWEGWEVVSVVPRTVVVGLMNVGGGSQAWGPGLGGTSRASTSSCSAWGCSPRTAPPPCPCSRATSCGPSGASGVDVVEARAVLGERPARPWLRYGPRTDSGRSCSTRTSTPAARATSSTQPPWPCSS